MLAEQTVQALVSHGAAAEGRSEEGVRARFWTQVPDGRVRCTLCPRGCTLREGQHGYCGVRENRGGALYTLVHSQVWAANVDPIEKKPFFHYLPGTNAYSIATVGCNVRCRFCQNWDLSQARPGEGRGNPMPPRRVAQLARRFNGPTIAYTYSEPVVFAEYVMDTADAGHAAGVRSVAVSNGYVQHDALAEIYGRMDAVKIDLKAFSESFYTRVVRGELRPVLETLLALRALGKWTEIVYLVIPTLNDGDAELRRLAQWIRTNLGQGVPLHFSRFHPEYQLQELPPTPVATLERARAIAMAEGLAYVYIGNVPGHPAQNTYCPACGSELVERIGFSASKVRIRNGACPFCAHVIPGIWHV